MALRLISKADQAAKEARDWKRELQQSTKREKTWYEAAEKVIERYRGEEKKKNRYNVLWSNTETLRPAIYNSRPSPDVRRRFRDADPLGKAVSEILERALMVMIDYECTDQTFKNDTLDGLLVGRGVSRIRYIPSLRQVGESAKPPGGETEQSGGEDTKSDQIGAQSGAEQEEIEYEQVLPEHVDWRDYRQGYGRVWDEVPWVAFRHKLTRADAQKKFDKTTISRVKYAAPEPDEKGKQGETSNELTKVSEFWEFWDKIGEKVFFTNEECEELLYPTENPDGKPPIAFSGFFPVPEPLRIIENTGSLIPIIPFHLYEQQADELDKLSGRINLIVSSTRMRGVYDAKMTELSDLMANMDNEMTPVQNAQAWIDGGGLEKAIAWFPTDQAAKVLETLYEARDRQKAIIDEITGISDIIRGATDPDETAKAQELKQTNASVRLQRMQKEVQRYAKDLIRLASEAMCEKIAPETFTSMTELQFPTALQKQQAQMQAQVQAQSVPPGQPPPPPNPILQLPSWEEIGTLMHSQGMRRFKVDVETDSTVAATLNSDMRGLTEVMVGVSEMMEKLAPIVSSGAMPIDAVKELVMAVIRRARMGMAVEDAFEKLKAPNPPPPPKEIQVAQIKAQTDEKNIQAKAQADIAKSNAEQAAQAQSRQAELAMEAQKSELEARIELQKDQQAKAHELTLKQAEGEIRLRELAMQLENERLIADAGNQTKIMVAEIAAGAQLAKQASQQEADAQSQDKDIAAQEAPTAAEYEKPESAIAPMLKELLETMKRPREVIRENGKIVRLQ